jgi:dihydrofolate reductase
MIKMIWAQSANGWIGKDGKMPWYDSEEMQHFKELTWGQTVLMGRNTLESLKMGALKNRKNVVVSTTLNSDQMLAAGVIVCPDPSVALAYARNPGNNIWIIGGLTMYDLFMPFADELHISTMKFNVEGDVAAPAIKGEWHIEDEIEYEKFNYQFLERRR